MRCPPPIRRIALSVVLAEGLLLGAACGTDASSPGGSSDAGSVDASAFDAPVTRDAGGGSDAAASDAHDAESVDAGPFRPYELASGGTAVLVTGPELGLQMTPANLV